MQHYSIMVVGANGQLARALGTGVHPPLMLPRFYSRTEINITDPSAILEIACAQGARLIINAAAYTQVDQAEIDKEAAHVLNAMLPLRLAQVAKELAIPIIHISSDYVFNGVHNLPYQESDMPDPISVYGKTKLAGEIAIEQSLDQHVILRTSWLFSPHGANFVKTMIKLAGKQDSLGVVADQMGCPTSAQQLASAIWKIAMAVLQEKEPRYGLFHYAGGPSVSWADFARAIMWEYARRTGKVVEIRNIKSDEYAALARRPSYSVFDCRKIFKAYGIGRPDWRPNIREIFESTPDSWQAL